MGKLGCDGARALGNCTGIQNDGAQNSLASEKERRTAFWPSRAEQALPRNLEKTESADKIKESAETEKATKKTRSKLFIWEFDCETKESRNSSHRLLPRHLLNSCGQGDIAQSEKTHWILL